MTAEIAILNQSGVAMAADSAVTIGLPTNDRKIYNTANKLFMLSKYHPVGIMIYNNAKIMGVEWEVIIKEYRKILGKQKFNTLKEYCTNFIEYLNTTRVFSEEQKRANFNQQIETSIKIIQKGIESKWNSVIGAKGSISDSQVKDITEKAIDEMLNDIGEESIIDYDFNKFLSKINDTRDILKRNGFNTFGEDINKKVLKLIYNNIA